jgi:hypothetical protein
MRFATIEEVLGRDTVNSIHHAVRDAYQTRCGDQSGLCALRELLVGVLAAVVTTERHIAVAQQLAAEDAAKLNALVRTIQEMRSPQPSTTIPSAGREVRPPVTMTLAAHRSRRALLASPRRAGRRDFARAGSVGRTQVWASGHMSLEACAQVQSDTVQLCHTSILRLRNRIDEAHIAISRSQALLAASRELAASVRAAAGQSG